MTDQSNTDAGRALEGQPNPGADTGVAPPASGSASSLDEGELETLQACAEAIHDIANRIRTDEKIRYLMGYRTQSFSLLTHALAKLCGVSDRRAVAYTLGETDEI